MNKTLGTTIALLPLAFALSARADDAPPVPQTAADVSTSAPVPQDLTNLNMDDLMNVQVTTASKKAESLNQVPAAIYVVTADDIRRSGAANVPEALRLVPGVDVAETNSQDYAISIRGFNQTYSDSLLVLVDGRSIFTNVFGGVSWQAQDIPLADIERIEVIRGPGGSLWGSNAVNGIINIITKNSKDTLGTRLSVESGTHIDGNTVTARYGAAAGSDASYRVSALGFQRGHSLNPDGTPDYNDWQGGRASVRFDKGDDKSGKLLVEGDVFRINEDQQFLGTTAGVAQFAIKGDYPYSGSSILANYEHANKDGSVTSIQGYYTHEDVQVALTAFRRDVYDVDFQDQLPTRDNNSVIFGAGYRAEPVNTDANNPVHFIPTRLIDRLYTAFMQDEIALKPTVHLTLGSKLEQNNYTGFEYQPNARIAFTPNDRHTLWASVARAVSTPSLLSRDVEISEGYVQPPGSPLPVEILALGNKANKSTAEVAEELGYRAQVTNAVTLDGTVFYNNYTNAQSEVPGTPYLTPTPLLHIVQPVVFTNVGSAHTEGLEVAARVKASEALRLDLSYTYLDGKVPAYGVQIAAPKSEYQIHSYYNVSKKLDFDTSLYFYGKGIDATLPSYNKLDVRFGYRPNDNLEISVGGRNILYGNHQQFGVILNVASDLIQNQIYGKVTWKI